MTPSLIERWACVFPPCTDDCSCEKLVTLFTKRPTRTQVVGEMNVKNQPVNVSDSSREITRTVAEYFGGEPSVFSYLSENSENTAAILSCPDIPQAAVTSYATIGLSNSQYRTTDDNLPLGVEILGACGSSFELFPNVLSSIYFQVISGQECAPNSVFRNVVASNNASKTMSHVLLVDPFVWSKSLPNLRFKDKTVSWLQSVPMSDGELNQSRVI